MVPVSFSPSTLNLKVAGAVAPPRPGTSPDHLPARSAACAHAAIVNSAPIVRIVLIPFSFRKNQFLRSLLYLLFVAQAFLPAVWFSVYRPAGRGLPVCSHSRG